MLGGRADGRAQDENLGSTFSIADGRLCGGVWEWGGGGWGCGLGTRLSHCDGEEEKAPLPLPRLQKQATHE